MALEYLVNWYQKYERTVKLGVALVATAGLTWYLLHRVDTWEKGLQETAVDTIASIREQFQLYPQEKTTDTLVGMQIAYPIREN